MHEVLVNRLGGLSLPRKSVVRLTDRPDMTLDVYRGRKTTMQQQQILFPFFIFLVLVILAYHYFPSFHDERHIKTTGKYLQSNDTKNGRNYHVYQLNGTKFSGRCPF